MPHAILRQVELNQAQLKTITELCEKHTAKVHIYQNRNGIIEVEFEFPFRYIIANNGHATYTGV